MGINVAQFVRQWALRDGSRSALLLPEPEGTRAVSYAELDQRATRAAAQLERRGLGLGTRVALTVHNGLGFLDAFLGGLYAGCTMIPVPTMSAPPAASAATPPWRPSISPPRSTESGWSTSRPASRSP